MRSLGPLMRGRLGASAPAPGTQRAALAAASVGICRAGGRAVASSAPRQAAAAAAGGQPPRAAGEGLAVVRTVRPTSGDAAAKWIKDAIAEYYGPREGLRYRSNAAFALRQIDDRFSIFKPDTVVLDLGCFAGGWSEVAVERSFASSSSSRVIGVDKVRMDPLDYHTFIHGDVAEDATIERVLEELGDSRADVVLSDLAVPSVELKLEDHLSSMQCCLNAARVMELTLRLGGWFVAKHLIGTEQNNWRTYLDSRFRSVRTIKPPASRPNHREAFMVCRDFLGRSPIAEEVIQPRSAFARYEGRDRWDSDIRRQRPRDLGHTDSDASDRGVGGGGAT